MFRIILLSLLSLAGIGFLATAHAQWNDGDATATTNEEASNRHPLVSLAQRFSTKEATPYYLNPRPERFHLVFEREPPREKKPQRGRPGLLQKVEQSFTYLPASGGDGMAVTSMDLSATVGLPCPTPTKPLLVTPAFSYTNIDLKDDAVMDISSDLYAARLGLFWMTPLGEKVTLILGASPSWNSDFKQDDTAAFRIPVHFGFLWTCNPRTKIMVGAAFLDRGDYPWIPFAGLTWTPTDDCILELGVPRTRFSRRFSSSDYWWFVGGEFGGSTWAVKREDGVNDLLLYNDYRAAIGIERRREPNAAARYKALRYFNWAAEIGYVFSRELKYDSDYGKKSPEDMVFFRVKLLF